MRVKEDYEKGHGKGRGYSRLPESEDRKHGWDERRCEKWGK